MPSTCVSGFSGLNFFPLALLSVDFLTPAVFAFFRPLQFWVLTTQPLLFLSLASCLRLAVASSVLVFRFPFLRFPRSSPPGFPCVLPRFRYSALLFVSFCPSLLRSHSCSTGAWSQLSLPPFSGSLPLPFVRFRFPSGYSAFCSSFPLFRLPPLRGFRRARFRSRFFAFPVLPSLVSHAFFPGSRTRLSVGFLSSFPASLPQLFHR